MAAKHAYTTVSARIDEEIKKEATRVLKEIGLMPAVAFRMMMRRIVAEDALPFDPLLPDTQTVQGTEVCRRVSSET